MSNVQPVMVPCNRSAAVVLIPDDIKNQPTINIHTLKLFDEINVDLELFEYSKV